VEESSPRGGGRWPLKVGGAEGKRKEGGLRSTAPGGGGRGGDLAVWTRRVEEGGPVHVVWRKTERGGARGECGPTGEERESGSGPKKQ
jgi:hypothetical protein